ncbi:pilus assembly protein PilZ [Salinisphaera sp. USBA-960]|uniref:PilZ domain-containing protein n=1 Tax=Salinisphaera orenii TaxID=856731 RepID=UPI000DBE2278|nr:pilus assembly protein PilZ [Salifodinibacter halophilus]NNC25703.1 pilus assembly protein PilZ [Salifodinibacter halophilus]
MAVQSNISDSCGVIHVDIADQNELFEAYMPFIQNGGVFVPRSEVAGQSYTLGDELFVFLQLLFENERLPVTGKICYIAPHGGQSPAGVGVQFLAKDAGQTQARIEALLAEQPHVTRPTKTL